MGPALRSQAGFGTPHARSRSAEPRRRRSASSSPESKPSALSRSTWSFFIGVSSLYTRSPVSVMIRITLRRYSGALSFDPLLLRPRHVVRPKQSFDRRPGNSTPAHGFAGQQLLAYRHVQHAPQHPQFLMDRRRLQSILSARIPSFAVTCTRCLSRRTKVHARCRRQSISASFGVPEHLASDASARADWPRGSSLRGSAAWSSSPGKSPPIRQTVSCSASPDAARAVCCCLWLADAPAASAALLASLRYMVDSRCRLPSWSRYRIHQNLAAIAFVQDTIMLTRSCHSQSPV